MVQIQILLMVEEMPFPGCQLKILRVVVLSILIDVMNDQFIGNGTVNLFPYPPVLKYRMPISES